MKLKQLEYIANMLSARMSQNIFVTCHPESGIRISPTPFCVKPLRRVVLAQHRSTPQKCVLFIKKIDHYKITVNNPWVVD